MKVLITGSTGGIGTYVVKRLLEAGHTLRAMDIPAQPKNDDYEYIPGDVRDLALLRRAVHGMEAVVHLAAIPYDMEGQDELVLDTNLRGTWNVLLASQEAGVKRVVSFSSINALGQAEPNHPGLYLPLDDDIPHHNVHNYPLTKHIGEEMCAAFVARGGLSAISLRPTLVTHPGPSRYRWWEFMPEEFKLQSHIGDFWSYVDVRDVAEATLLSLTAPVEKHQAFLLAHDENRTHTPTAEIVEKHFAHLPWPKISKEAYLAQGEFIGLLDCSAAKRVLGWQPQYSRFDPAAGYE
jgi:nucleoside-diphosphate-sugar epimerase